MLVNLDTSVIGRRRAFPLAALMRRRPARGSKAAGRRDRRAPACYADGALARRRSVFDREQLPPGARIAGPAIVEQLDATTVIEPGATATVDAIGNLRIRRGGTAAMSRRRSHHPGGDPGRPAAGLQRDGHRLLARGLLAGDRRGRRPLVGHLRQDTGALISQGELGLPVFVGTMQYSTARADPPDRRGQGRARPSPATSTSSTTPISAARI